MRYTSKLLLDGRWGIYVERDLLATIGCPQTCQAIVALLNQRSLQAQNRQGRELAINNQEFDGIAPSCEHVAETASSISITVKR